MSSEANPSNVPATDNLDPPTEIQLIWITSLLEQTHAEEKSLKVLFGPEFTRISELSGHAVEWGIHQILTFLQEIEYHGEDNPDDLLQPLQPRTYL